MYYYKADEWKSEIHRPMTQLRHDVAKRFWAISDLISPVLWDKIFLGPQRGAIMLQPYFQKRPNYGLEVL